MTLMVMGCFLLFVAGECLDVSVLVSPLREFIQMGHCK